MGELSNSADIRADIHESITIRAMKQTDVQAVSAVMTQGFGPCADTDALLETYVSDCDVYAIVAIDETTGECVGFCSG